MVALLAVAASMLSAQSVTEWSAVKALNPGARIRVETAPRKLSGEFRSASDDALVLRAGAGEETVVRSQVTRIAVRKPGHRKRNAIIGLGVGAGVGLGVGAAARSHCTGFCINPVSNGVVVGAGAAAGGLVGVVVGAIIPTGGWRDLYHAPVP